MWGKIRHFLGIRDCALCTDLNQEIRKIILLKIAWYKVLGQLSDPSITILLYRDVYKGHHENKRDIFF